MKKGAHLSFEYGEQPSGKEEKERHNYTGKGPNRVRIGSVLQEERLKEKTRVFHVRWEFLGLYLSDTSWNLRGRKKELLPSGSWEVKLASLAKERHSEGGTSVSPPAGQESTGAGEGQHGFRQEREKTA